MSKVAGNTCKYMEIYQYYKDEILSRRLTTGQKLPTEIEIGAIFQVSRITVVKAMNILVSEGYIYRRKGKGTFVAQLPFPEETASLSPNVAFISLIMAFKPTGIESRLLESIEKEISKAGYLLSVSNSYGEPEEERRCIMNVKDIAKGIILYPSSSNSNNDLYFELFQQNYPIVFIDRYPANLPCCCVTSDNRNGGFQIGQWFLNHGHRKFAMAFHNLIHFSSERDRYDGFINALRQQNLSDAEVSFYSVEQEGSQLEQLVRELISPPDPSSPITAVFACNDFTAARLITRLSERGYDFNSKLVIAGFDGLYTPPLGVPFLTVRQDYPAIGKTAAYFLLNKITAKTPFYTETSEIPVELAESTDLQKQNADMQKTL